MDRAKKPADRRRSRIPAGRLERLGRIGWMAGEMAIGGLWEGTRRAAGVANADGHVLLTEANARRLAKRLSGLRGAAMKLGQLVSMEGDDFLPAEFTEALAILRSDADAMPRTQLRRVLGRAWGRSWANRFERFDLEPIAAASIGQVHAGTTRDGRELAVKVQYPGVANSIESDVDNLASIFRMARLLPGEIDVTGIVEEAKRQLRQEADYHTEGVHLDRYRALLADDPELVVPRVHADLTTRRVLAMDRLEGLPLEDLAGPDHPQERRDRVATALYRLLFREIFEFRFVQTDPNLANYLWLPDGDRVGLLDLGAAREMPAALADRYRRLFRAGVDSDRRGLRDAAIEIGFCAADERRDRIDGVVELLHLGCEAFRGKDVYDFAGSDLAARIRATAMDLAFQKGFMRTPPPETMFLHRKLAGLFLLCARLRARVALGPLIEPFVEGDDGDFLAA